MRKLDLTSYAYLKALFYGNPGSTKTRTAATAAMDPRTSPVLMLNAAGNPISVRDYPARPDIVEMESLKEFNVPYVWLAGGQRPDHPFCKEYGLNPPYKTVIVDSITEVQRMSFGEQTGAKSLGPGDFSSRVERQHFGNVLAQMITFAKLYFSLPMNVILTSLERQDQNESTGAITYQPLLWGQSGGEVGGYAYLVARLMHRAAVQKGLLSALETPASGVPITSVAFFKPSGTFVAKDQYGRLGDYMVDPTIPKMMDMIFGE